jgi:hypothetical protein
MEAAERQVQEDRQRELATEGERKEAEECQRKDERQHEEGTTVDDDSWELLDNE